MVDARCGRGGDAGLAWKATPRPASSSIGDVVCAVARGERVLRASPRRSRSSIERGDLRLAAEDRLGDLAGELAAVDQESIGLVLVEADHGGDAVGEGRETAGHEAGVGVVRPHGGDQRASARGEADALGDHLLDDRRGEPLEQRDALAQRRLERDLAAHRPLGDRRDVRLEPHIIGELVDAFLADHGGVHVGDEQPLAPARQRLHHHVDRAVAVQAAKLIGDARLPGLPSGRKGMSAAIARREPSWRRRRRARLAWRGRGSRR